MLILALAILVVALVWLFATRAKPVDPVVRRVGLGFAIVCVAGALALRVGLAVGLVVIVVSALVAWLRLRGTGGDDGGDDGPDPPDDPGPDPGHGNGVRHDRLDPDAFDRARAQWENELPKRS